MTTTNDIEIESIDVAPDDLIAALATQVHEMNDHDHGKRFVLVGDGPHKMAELHDKEVAREYEDNEIDILLLGTDFVDDAGDAKEEMQLGDNTVEINLI